MHNDLMTSKTLARPRWYQRRKFSLMSCLLLTTSALVIPLSLLLFAQWPLREWVQAWSRQANDIAQIVFAIYVAVAITAASRARTHLAAVGMTAGDHHGARPAPVWRSGLMLACVGPWALFTLWAGKAQIIFSLKGLEQFADTQTPGYFVIKLALALLLVLVLIDAVLTWLAAWQHKV